MTSVVAISIPTTGYLRAELVQWLLIQQMMQKSVTYRTGVDMTLGNLGVARQRNMAVSKALSHKDPFVTHVLFVDDDVQPPASIDVIGRMLAADKPIVTGAVPTVTPEGDAVFSAFFLTEKEEPDLDHLRDGRLFRFVQKSERIDELQRVDGCGMALCLIRREVFDNVQFPWFQSLDNQSGNIIGEDLYFCLNARRSGFDVWMDWGIVGTHFKVVGMNQEFC
jgi:GT2 family glycosyltransferase